MHRGNVNAAIKLLTNNMQNGILRINKDTLKLLEQKHPQSRSDTPEVTHLVKFETIDAYSIRKTVKKTRGGSGPSGMDADAWRKVILSKSFGESSNDFCSALAKVTKKFCTENCNPEQKIVILKV